MQANVEAPPKQQVVPSPQNDPRGVQPHFAEMRKYFMAGWLAGAAGELLLGHPLSTVCAHLEDAHAARLLRPALYSLFSKPETHTFKEGISMKQLTQTAALLMRRDGLSGFYRGATLPVLAGSFAGAAAFTSYHGLRQWLQDCRGWGRRSSAVVCGAASGVMVSIAVAPLELATIRLQLAPPRPEALAARGVPWTQQFIFRAALLLHGRPLFSVEETLRRRGWWALWTGLGPLMLREVCNFSLFYVTYEEVRGFLETHTGTPRLLAIMAGGAAAGGVGITCAQPMAAMVTERYAELERILRGEQAVAAPTQVLVRRVLSEGGASRLRQGLSIGLLRAMPMNAFVFLTFVNALPWC